MNISAVLGHDSIETTLRFYIHASANAEQRIGAMMNARWTTNPARNEASASAGDDHPDTPKGHPQAAKVPLQDRQRVS
jgi:hypothetical protein